MVLGRRQIASWLFLGTVLIAISSAAAYYVGKMSAPNYLAELSGQTAPYIAPSLPEASIVLPGPDPNLLSNAASPDATPASKAASVSPPPRVSVAPASPSIASISPAASVKLAAPSTALPALATPTSPDASNSVAPRGEPPLYANPQPGALYLQMGAVEKGIAVVLAEGLRRHGFNSIVAPGPSEKIFRVLIGPFASQDDYRRAKAEVDAIDLSTFARRFQK